jgi:hypothetical protein
MSVLAVVAWILTIFLWVVIPAALVRADILDHRRDRAR